jgi:flagellar basal-body rod protein FlgF
MDRALYVAMTGALQTMRAQVANNRNIANASTTGFKAELVTNGMTPVQGGGFPTRVNADSGTLGWDSTGGGVQSTGNPLDVALGENLWLAVQASDGSEAYTRAGDLKLDANGLLRTSAGMPVLGEGGPLSIPPSASVSVGGDGTVSVVPLGQSPNTLAAIGRLKIVSAQPEALERGDDGLMRARNGVTPDAASGTVLTAGALESSNVNLPDTMVTMIQLARSFDMQMKLMKSVEENGAAAASIMRMG